MASEILSDIAHQFMESSSQACAWHLENQVWGCERLHSFSCRLRVTLRVLIWWLAFLLGAVPRCVVAVSMLHKTYQKCMLMAVARCCWACLVLEEGFGNNGVGVEVVCHKAEWRFVSRSLLYRHIARRATRLL